MSPAGGSAPGYDQVYTALRQASLAPSVDLVLLRSADPGGPNLTVTFSVVGPVALRTGYSYQVEFNRSSPTSGCAGGGTTCPARVNCGAGASGAPACALSDRSGLGSVRWALANASTTVVFSVAKSVLPTATGFCLWASASGPGSLGNRLGCGVAPASGSGGYATGSPFGSPEALALVSGAIVVAALVAVGIALLRRRPRPPVTALPTAPPSEFPLEPPAS